jgi:hypothetical protein
MRMANKAMVLGRAPEATAFGDAMDSLVRERITYAN